MRRLAPYCLATLLSLTGVSCAGAAGSPLVVHVDWGLDGPSGTIPMGVTQLNVTVYAPGMMPQTSVSTVPNLMDMDGDGHLDVVRGSLPTGVPIHLTIQGEGAGNAVLYLGHVGPFTLEAGQRRYLSLRMYATAGYSSVDPGTMTPRMLATATPLSDGRVLVTGGFTHAAVMPCPTGTAAMSVCYDLTAASDAFIFDIASGNFLPVHNGMRAARGGHTATLLPGDRVLIAGGAAHAMLVLEASTPPPASLVFRPQLVTLDTSTQSSASFEVFLPDANAEVEDTDRNGDPGRGGFVGAADDPTTLGRLDQPRFMHGAAAVPGHPSQVLLAGGLETPGSWVIYDDARAGGYGVLDSTANHLHTARPMASVVPLHGATGDSLWIFGGDAASNTDLAEIWTTSMTVPSGTTASVPMTFPDGMMPSGAPHPEYALVGASAVSLDAQHAVLVGWYGPYCAPTALTTPVFAGGAGVVRCDAPTTGSSRSFTVDGMTGHATATATRNRHAFGAGVRLDDGSALVNGGFGALLLTTSNTTEHFSAMVSSGGPATTDEVQPLLGQTRAFHTMAALADGGALVIGGVSITGATPMLTLVGPAEVFYLTQTPNH